NSWTVGIGELVSPGENSTLRSSREYDDFELELEFKNDGEKEATLRFGKYSESDSHPVRIYLSNNNTPGWHKLRITAQGTSAAGVIKSCNTGESVFPEATIREKPSTPVPLVFQGANLRLRNIKIRPINTKPVEKALQELLKRKSSSAAVVLFE